MVVPNSTKKASWDLSDGSSMFDPYDTRNHLVTRLFSMKFIRRTCVGAVIVIGIFNNM